ncbi:helix-turn-helix domain-containing protein [Streptomyces sp. NPDC007940]|uniref:helix-turn-helix domain-containing protein n=1 Tax=Streptomyces sp. NPDC007940 TaxID=3364796 RepID=UPI0036E2BEBC
MQAAELFERKMKPTEVARRLRVSRKSAYQWHQLWRDGGVQALASRGPSGSRCHLSPRCLGEASRASGTVRFPRCARDADQLVREG